MNLVDDLAPGLPGIDALRALIASGGRPPIGESARRPNGGDGLFGCPDAPRRALILTDADGGRSGPARPHRARPSLGSARGRSRS